MYLLGEWKGEYSIIIMYNMINSSASLQFPYPTKTQCSGSGAGAVTVELTTCCALLCCDQLCYRPIHVLAGCESTYFISRESGEGQQQQKKQRTEEALIAWQKKISQ